MLKYFKILFKKNGKAYVETDMRAHFNPTRMNVIKQLAKKLVSVINCKCPKCKTPGFDVQDIKKGLPCEWCNTPTKSTLSYIYICKKCNYKEEQFYPRGIQFEDPTYCDNCNP